MKKFLLLTLAVVSLIEVTKAQGLENIIVEKYYISDNNDTNVNSTGGTLPVGSVTYRIYVDMLPDYIFQSAYGDPNHECRIETSTLFFNNEDRGAVHPTFSVNYCDDNTVMLDSWLSVGAACAARMGIQKSQDDGVNTIVNGDGVLQNTDPLMGIPLTQQDGLIAGTPEPVVTVGIGTEIMVFDSQNDGTNGPVFSTFNGAWASLNGSVGPDPALNQVLIAQITTDGILSFQLNVQIRNQTTFAVENYVASNPTGTEILFPALNYNSATGISNTPEAGYISQLYPNPASSTVNLTISGIEKPSTGTVKVFDLLGNLVSTKSLTLSAGNSQYKMDISDLSSGIYFVQLSIGKSIISKKLVKN